MNGAIALYRAPDGLVGLDALIPEPAGFGMLATMLADKSARVFFARQFDQGGPIMFEAQVLPDALDAVLAEGPAVTVELDDEVELTSLHPL
jgi:hypothetical protein